MKKLLLFLIVIIAVGGFLAFKMSNILLAKGLEAAIGAPVKIDKVNLTSSHAGIQGITVKNPAGFEEPVLASIPEIYLEWDLSNLFKKQLLIREVRLNLDEVTVERSQSGTVNLTELAAVKRPAGKPGQKPAPAEKGAAAPAIEIQIQRVEISIGRARYVDKQVGLVKEFPIEVQKAVLENVTDPAQVTQQVVKIVLQKVGMNAALSQLGNLAGDKGLGGEAAEEIKQVFGGLKDKLSL